MPRVKDYEKHLNYELSDEDAMKEESIRQKRITKEKRESLKKKKEEKKHGAEGARIVPDL